jgi:hypothetical protein
LIRKTLEKIFEPVGCYQWGINTLSSKGNKTFEGKRIKIRPVKDFNQGRRSPY